MAPSCRIVLAFFRISPVILLLLFPLVPAEASCPPGMTPEASSESLSHAIGRLNRFFDRTQEVSSFNYDRMLYLVDELSRREKAWSLCFPGSVSGSQTLIEDRIAVLKGEILRSRSLPAGEAPTPREAIAEARRILSRIPVVASLPPAAQKLPSPPQKNSSLLSRPLLLLLVLFLLGGGLLLAFGVRLLGRKGGSERGEHLFESFRRMGAQWQESARARSELLEAMKSRVGQGKAFVRIRAQLYIRDAESREWRLSDELSQDEGGFLRSFGEEAERIVPEKSVEEVSLGEGESRIRLVVPMGAEGDPSALLVVDALSSPSIVSGAPDPSGLLTLENFKERLFEIVHRSSGPVSVLSFSFDAPEMQGILERSGEEAEGLRSFVVREAIALIGPGTVVFGEPPGIFHVILWGKEERRAGEILLALSSGLGPTGGGEGSETLERPWFRKTLVAHTRWRTSEPGGLDGILDRIKSNMKKLRDNPAIRTVNDA